MCQDAIEDIEGVVDALEEVPLTHIGQDPPRLIGQPDAGLRSSVVLEMACVDTNSVMQDRSQE